MELRRRGIASFGAAIALAASLMCALALPTTAIADDGDVSWPDPTGVLSTKTYAADGSVETQQVLASAKGTYQVYALWLGLADTVTDGPGGGFDGSASLSGFEQSALFGTYASPVNSEPDVYMSNLWYSYYNENSGLSAENRDEIALIISGQPTSADTTVLIGGTSGSLYYRPDLIVGGNQGNSYSGSAYVSLVEAINSGSIGAENYVDGDEDYDPYIMDGWYDYVETADGQSVDGSTISYDSSTRNYDGDEGYVSYGGYQGSTRGSAQMLYNMAMVVERVKDTDDTKVTRYGDDTQRLAEQFEELFIGVQSNIVSKIQSGEIEKVTYAAVTAIDADTQTATIGWISDEYQTGTKNGQEAAPQYALAAVADNLAITLGLADTESATSGSVTVTLDQLATVDIAIYTGQNQTGVTQETVEAAYAAAGLEAPTGLYTNPQNVGSGNYDADKCIYQLCWLGACYPEVATSSELMAYFYSQISHVSDDYLANVMLLNCGDMTLMSGDTINRSQDEWLACVDEVQDVIDEGMTAYAANVESFVAYNCNLEAAKDSTGALRNTKLAAVIAGEDTYGEEELAVDNVAGDDRVLTAIETAKWAYPNGADGVIVAYANNYPDALAAGSLAGALGYPIILVNDSNADVVEGAIAELGAEDVIVVGGTSSISDDIYNAIGADMRISGSDRYETQMAIYAYGEKNDLWSSSTAIIASGANSADALAISAYAAAQKAPVFLCSQEGLTDDAASAIANYGSVIVVGGTAWISDDVVESTGAERIAGANRYETSAKIAELCVESGMSTTVVGVAAGEDDKYPDALVAGPAVAAKGGVLVLVEGQGSDTSAASAVVTQAATSVATLAYFGGTNTINDDVRTIVTALF